MRYNVSFIFLRVLATVSLKDVVVSALSVTSTDEVIGVNGGNAEFNISYALGSGENFTKVVFKKLDGSYVFEAPFFVPPSTINVDGVFHGDFKSRGSTDFSSGKTNFIITLSQVTPDDEGQYFVDVSATGGKVKSSESQVVVDFLPSAPSISGTPTQSVLGGAGPTVLICAANLGKPQASMVWSRRIGSGAYTDITENFTSATANNNDGTTSGTSTLTVNLDTADDGVHFRCQVSNRQATLSAETQTIKVTVPSPHKGLTDAAVAGIVISVCLVVIVLIVLLVILIRRGIILLPCTGGNSRPNDKLHVQTPGNVHTADTVTYVNGMVRTGFPSTGHRNLDDAVADLLESLALQSHAQAFEREQITAPCLAELTIEDLTLRLGVPLGPSRMMLKRIRTLGLHKQVDTNQVLDGAYSDVGPPVYQEAVDVAYANVAQTPVYEGLADSTKGAQGDYAKLQGATMGDKPSEYETVMKTSQ